MTCVIEEHASEMNLYVFSPINIFASFKHILFFPFGIMLFDEKKELYEENIFYKCEELLFYFLI